MHAFKTISTLAGTLGVASAAAITGVPVTSQRLGEGQATTPLLPFVAAAMQFNPAYQAIYGTPAVHLPVVPIPVTPLLRSSNATCGVEEEAVEVAKWFGTCPMLPLKRVGATMVANPTYRAIYGPRPVKGPVFFLGAPTLVQPISQPEAMQLVVAFHGTDFVLLPGRGVAAPLPPSDWLRFFHIKDSQVIPQDQRVFNWIALWGLTVVQAALIKSIVRREKKAAKKGRRKAAAAALKAKPFPDLGETTVGGLLGKEVKGAEAVPPFFMATYFNLASTYLNAPFGKEVEGAAARPPFYDFEFEMLAETSVGEILGEEVEGVDAFPPFKQLVVTKKANKGMWTLSRVLRVVLPARRSRGSESFRASISSTAAAAEVGSDDRGRSESVLPRGVVSGSINVDGAGVLCPAEGEKEATRGSKMAGLRAAVSRIFKGGRKGTSSRATASSVCEMVKM